MHTYSIVDERLVPLLEIASDTASQYLSIAVR